MQLRRLLLLRPSSSSSTLLAAARPLGLAAGSQQNALLWHRRRRLLALGGAQPSRALPVGAMSFDSSVSAHTGSAVVHWFARHMGHSSSNSSAAGGASPPTVTGSCGSVRRMAAMNRKHIIQTWTALHDADPAILDKAISSAWLKAAEETPTWVWALVDLPETMHSTYQQSCRFVNLVQDVREFFHTLIKVHRCDWDMVKTLSFRLGNRHLKYMNVGNDNAYWTPFAKTLPAEVVKAYYELHAEDHRRIKLLKFRAKSSERNELEELTASWRDFMNVVVEAMKRGYEGCATEKTALRLSLTNSIISMASIRSARSRSASHLLVPSLLPTSPAPNEQDEEKEEESSSSNDVQSRHTRSRSIFRNRPTRNSQEITLRRLSSPNSHHGAAMHNDKKLSTPEKTPNTLTICPIAK